MLEYKLYIDGQFRDASDKNTFDSINPYDKSIAAKIAKATVQDYKGCCISGKESF